MPVADKTTRETKLCVQGGGASPPTVPDEDSGGHGPNGDQTRLMLLIHETRDHTASLDYLRGWSGLPRQRVWRAYEELEGLGYVEHLEDDPRGPVSRWLDARRGENDRIFASTFLRLTEAGRHSTELQALLVALADARRDQQPTRGLGVSVREGLSRLLRKHTARR